ncbi:MAG: sigma-70 family RNA polymerase sigma factor [Rhodocyclaceae bacterium]|nr:sigma-70 family RNA polymerase sigma factor [Rhodocyclaceae bacterium]
MTPDPLIDRFRRGDPQAFEVLVRRWQHPVFAYLGRLGLDRRDGEEVAQEAFVRTWQQRERFDPARAGFATWLLTIARNLAFDRIARDGRHPPRSLDTLPEAIDEAPGPAERHRLAERRAALRAALATLPAADRSVLALSYFRDLDMATIARIEGCSEAAVKQRLYRARRALRQRLEDFHD